MSKTECLVWNDKEVEVGDEVQILAGVRDRLGTAYRYSRDSGFKRDTQRV
jgi:hypothetical protein